jgi:hypothetical protein
LLRKFERLSTNFAPSIFEAGTIPILDTEVSSSANQDDFELLKDSLDNLSKTKKKELLNILAELCGTFSKIPGRKTIVKHHNDTSGSQLIRQRPYLISQSRKQAIEEEVPQMLELGIIQPSTSTWCSLVVVVAKPDQTIRFCLDFRAFNRNSKFDSYPLPRIDELLKTVGNQKVFSILDLTKGYWQIKLTKESKEKTALNRVRAI